MTMLVWYKDNLTYADVCIYKCGKLLYQNNVVIDYLHI